MSQFCQKIRVAGRVQGVFFRAFTQKKAQDLQLTGWTRNESDGSVLVLACGEAESLDALVKALNQGPPAAQVTSIQIEPVDYQVFADFVIQR
jgi:acylphosphatase